MQAEHKCCIVLQIIFIIFLSYKRHLFGSVFATFARLRKIPGGSICPIGILLNAKAIANSNKRLQTIVNR